MPVLFEFAPELNLLYYAGFGICTGEEFFKAERLAFHHEFRQKGMLIMIDIRSAKEVDFGVNNIKQAIELLSQLKAQNHQFEKTAVLSHSSVANTFMSAYRLLTSEYTTEISVFNSVGEAATWLGLSGIDDRISQIKNHLMDGFENNNTFS